MPPVTQPPRIVISCEHATARVPARWRADFKTAERALASHRGIDFGAWTLAKALARKLGVTPHAAKATRLLADPNRSLDHPRLFSEWTRDASADEKERMLDAAWRPHRAAVRAAVEEALAERGARVVHLSVHSFTPVMDGKVRDVDVGFLYDPSRERERALVDRWIAALAERRPDLRLRRNRPYTGTSDGLIPAFREQFPRTRYVGVELEVNQRFPLGDRRAWTALRRDLVASFAELV